MNYESVDCVRVVPTGRWGVRFCVSGKEGVHDDVKLWPDIHSAQRRVDEFREAGAGWAGCSEIYQLPDGREFCGHRLPAGCFQWEVSTVGMELRYLYIVLPGGEGNFDAIRVQQGAGNGARVWGWDGNEEKPTLTPSIHWIGVWHGFLQAGRLNSLAPPVFIGPQP